MTLVIALIYLAVHYFAFCMCRAAALGDQQLAAGGFESLFDMTNRIYDQHVSR